MSKLTGIINRAVGPRAGWEASSILPIQRRVGPAPASVMGTDESGKMQPFTQPGLALGVPGMISSPVKSLATSADKLEQGQVPDTEDVMPFLLATASPSLGSEGDAALSAGSRFRILEGGKKAIPVVKGTAPTEEATKSLGFLLAHKEPGREQYDYRVVGKKLPPQEGSFGLHVTAPFQSQAEAITELARMKKSGEIPDNTMILPAELMDRYLKQLQKSNTVQLRNKLTGNIFETTKPETYFGSSNRTGSGEPIYERITKQPVISRLDDYLKQEQLKNQSGLINRPNITPGSIVKSRISLISPSSLKVSKGTSDLDKATVSDYRDAIKSGRKIPAVQVIQNLETGDYYVLDGHHRLEAAKAEGVEQIPIEIMARKNSLDEVNSIVRSGLK